MQDVALMTLASARIPPVAIAMPVLLEVCVDSVASAVASEGGVTPSAGLIAMVRKRIALPLHVLARPRAGDSCYTPDEFEVMKRDILLAKQLGASGVVAGILLPDHRVDVLRTRELVELARPLSLTFHRAFDTTPDLITALEDVIAAGAERILTSGGSRTAEEGSAMIAKLVATAGQRITILACGHVREHNVASLLNATRVKEVHANLQTQTSARAITSEADSGAALFGEPPRFEVLPSTVALFLEAVAKTGVGEDCIP
jgi:copper homeostasis protein